MRQVAGVMTAPIAEQGCLHLLFSRDSDTVQACLSHCCAGDSVVLLNTAASLLLDKSWNQGMVAGVSMHAVQADVLAQGMSGVLENRGCQLISDSEWVGLVMRYPHCLSWK